MKKNLCVMLALLMLLAGCGSKQPTVETTQPVTEASAETVPETTGEVTEATEETAAAEEVTETTEEAVPEEEPFESAFQFTTTDFAGETVTEAIFKGYDLIFINFWEPWCGPCVGEMPDLERLNQAYGDRVLILGVFNTEDGVAEVLADTGVTYPILRACPEFEPFYTPYVPTTVFLSEHGAVLKEPEPGAMPYEMWEILVNMYLQ